MLGRTNTGGGGGGLNFRVIGGTSVPSNPKDNDIWVNTKYKITGYIFSVTEPEKYEEGIVWFPTGKTGQVEFNALKKNTIQIYPLSANQYINGVWNDVTAMSYQNGEWSEWIRTIYVFENGAASAGNVECYKTGQWSEAEIDENGNIYLYPVNDNYAGFYVSEPFNVTNYSKIVFVASLYNEYGKSPGTFNYGVGSNTTHGSFVAKGSFKINATTQPDFAEFVVDITSLDGEYYVKGDISRTGTGDQDHCYISEIRLEQM